MKSRKKFLISLLAGLSTLTFTLALGSCGTSEQPHIHTWGEMQINKLPTCTEKGEIVCVCKDCEETNTIAVAELGHSYVLDEENSTELTCETDGKTVEVCERYGCGAVIETKLPATGHNFVDAECACGEVHFSKYLKYTLNEDGQSYSVGFWASIEEAESFLEEAQEKIEEAGIEDENAMREYICRLSPYANSKGAITIPSEYNNLPITTISDVGFAFSSFSEVNIPNTITSIGASAFFGCRSLTSIEIGDGVTSIGHQAFYLCDSLTSVVIGDSVTSIGGYAFCGCTSLTNVTFENTEGWFVADSSTATSGTNISSTDLSNTATAATYLKSTYNDFYWKRSE